MQDRPLVTGDVAQGGEGGGGGGAGREAAAAVAQRGPQPVACAGVAEPAAEAAPPSAGDLNLDPLCDLNSILILILYTATAADDGLGGRERTRL